MRCLITSFPVMMSSFIKFFSVGRLYGLVRFCNICIMFVFEIILPLILRDKDTDKLVLLLG